MAISALDAADGGGHAGMHPSWFFFARTVEDALRVHDTPHSQLDNLKERETILPLRASGVLDRELLDRVP